jgi:hypothetical protein
MNENKLVEKAFQEITEALRPLKDDDARRRVLRAAAVLLGIDPELREVIGTSSKPGEKDRFRPTS